MHKRSSFGGGCEARPRVPRPRGPEDKKKKYRHPASGIKIFLENSIKAKITVINQKQQQLWQEQIQTPYILAIAYDVPGHTGDSSYFYE